ncbi:ATP-binding protein [Pseudodesulfovibrio sp. zrk46]|uniref:ATP-binding protein n=1 Tax=Pseudodesulfovibrio sp. zrk46 TaxID=2725288 RepID=UPI001449BD8B|nr:ATP-binding protein [Pseudodesulfovibrio sp. zrk46]QJB56705.1 response regulator [Pseudodesulfovibrio sp. zrk46]
MNKDQKPRRRASDVLGRKAALVQTATTTVVVLLFSAAIIIFNAYRLNRQVEHRLDGIALLGETSLASAVWQVDHASARDFIDAVLRDESVVFAQVVTGRETMASKAKPRFAGRSFQSFEKDSDFRTRTVEIRKYGEWIGTFNIASNTATYRHDLLVNALGTLALGMALILAISQTTLFFSRKRIFGPLKQLEESAISIADGELEAPINTNLPGELGTLARAIDDMRESVRHLIQDLREANTRLADHKNALENTVKTRTDELKQKNISLNQALEEVRTAQKSAEVANLAKSRFLASMSHEIRTPMNAILGMADILWETELTKDQAKYVQVFRTAGESLLEILDDILDLSKIEAGHLTLESTSFSLSETVDKACNVVEPKAQQKGLEFSCFITPDVPDRLEGDPTRLRQILLNLLGNALKFTDSGTIHLLVEKTPNTTGRDVLIQFSVMDTGPGIPPDKLSSIFESFTQADSSTTRKFGGTGLGLAISKQLVQMMGGRIWAESSVGNGSTFLFTACFTPLSISAPSVSKTVAVTRAPELPTLNILMMEDSKYNAFVIQTYLQNSPCTLTVAENGEAGLELFHENQYDVVLMDIQMPEMDGYQATRAIRKWEAAQNLPPTPIIAMTAFAHPEDTEKCLAAGANDHVAKPVKKSTLFDRLRAITQPDNTSEQTADPVQGSTPEQEAPTASLAPEDLRQTILAAFAAVDQKDIPTLLEKANTLSQQGEMLNLETVSGYGDALKNAVDNGNDPEHVQQILKVLSEYIERLDSV